ncbi:hypothetical protein ACFUJU_07800 [Streptomyces sp. NPDC057235]|uniref:hypothetical protein n=1 Tax=Streptomyces sp. NPDC057235 TaxID=3346058 RepID=UPI0036341FFE
MNLGIVWEEPAPRGGHDLIADQLREEPGRWARIDRLYQHKNALSIARSIRLGRMPAYEPPGDFDACSRVQGAKSYVYVRYLGNGVSNE